MTASGAVGAGRHDRDRLRRRTSMGAVFDIRVRDLGSPGDDLVPGPEFAELRRALRQLLRYALKAPEPNGDLERFMVTTFVDAVRDCLKEGGWAAKDNEREEGGEFLVGVHGRLFCVESDYQVGEAVDGFAAIGCGQEIALGALYATARSRMAPEKRIKLALEAAERFSAGVRGPFAHVSKKAE